MRKNIEDYVNDFIASLENDNDDSLSSDKPMDRDELLKRLEEIEAAYSDEGQAGTDISELPPLPTYEYKEYDAADGRGDRQDPRRAVCPTTARRA